MRQFGRLGEHALQETVGFHFLDRMVGLHRCAATDDTSKVFAVFTEVVAIGKENQRVLPTDKFATHREDRTIGVGRALLLEHLRRDIDIVQDDDVLAQNLYMGDVA